MTELFTFVSHAVLFVPYRLLRDTLSSAVKVVRENHLELCNA
jgi:hypothetical protein